MRSVSGNQVAYAGMLALAVAMGVGRFAFTPLLPMMEDDYGLPVAEGAWLATANYAGYLAGALIAMATAVYPVAAIGGGLIVIGVATLGMGLTHDYAAWIVLRALAGMASAWVMIYVASWCLEQLVALRKPLLNGRIFAGVGLGITVTGLLSMGIMNWRSSAAAAWMTLGAISLIVVLVIAPVLFTRADVNSRPATTLPQRAMQWDSGSIRLVVCFASSGFGYIVPATFLPAMAKQVMHDPAIFGWSWPVFGTAALVSTLAASALRRHIGNRQLWIASQLLMALGVALPALWRGMAAIILAGLLVGGTFMVITMAAIQEARAIAGPAIGLLSALTAAFAVGQLLGPMSVSLLITLGGGLSSSLLLASGVLTAGAVVLYCSPRSAIIARPRSVF